MLTKNKKTTYAKRTSKGTPAKKTASPLDVDGISVRVSTKEILQTLRANRTFPKINSIGVVREPNDAAVGYKKNSKKKK